MHSPTLVSIRLALQLTLFVLSAAAALAQDFKELKFPDSSIGSLYAPTRGEELSKRKFEAPFLAPARGTVRLPAKQIVILECSYAVVQNPKLLDGIKDGTVQAFRFNNIEGGDEVLQHIAHWKNLRRLALNQTEVTDHGVAYLKNMTALEALILSRDDSTGKTLFGLTLPKLRFLEYSFHEIDRQAAKNIKNWSSLEILDLSRTGIDDDCLEAIGHLSKLRYLDIGDNKLLTNRGSSYLNNLKELNYLDLRNTSMTTAALLKIKLPKLEALVLPDWHYSKAELDQLRKNFKTAQVYMKAPDINLKKTKDADLFSPLH